MLLDVFHLNLFRITPNKPFVDIKISRGVIDPLIKGSIRGVLYKEKSLMEIYGSLNKKVRDRDKVNAIEFFPCSAGFLFNFSPSDF